jgi:hypothetical protein
MSNLQEYFESPGDSLHAAICLLALITQRPANLEEIVPESNKKIGLFEEKAASDGNVEEDDGEEEDEENVAIVDIDDGRPRDLSTLRSKVLDRLAEMLARYKSDPKKRGDPALDPKHVSSTMMIVHDKQNKVKILCSKNEGLDQGGSSEDTSFLNSWKKRMELISRAGTSTVSIRLSPLTDLGTASEEDRTSLLDLVVDYQKPRIDYYVQKLGSAFQLKVTKAKNRETDKKPKLSEEWLQRLPILTSRCWIDDFGNEFKFKTRASDDVGEETNVALSGHSMDVLDTELNKIFELIGKLFHSNKEPVNTAELAHGQQSIVKELLPSMFAVWKGARFQAAIKARLHLRFRGSSNALKRQNETIKALKFLCRIYYSVVTFVEAAETLPIFQSVEHIPVYIPPTDSVLSYSTAVGERMTLLKTVTALDL